MADMDRFFCLHLKDGKPEVLPDSIQGRNGVVTRIQAESTDFQKIAVEAIAQVVRLDKIDDENDSAVSDFIGFTVGTVFPSRPSTNVNVQFSYLNSLSFQATGGDVVISGLFSPENLLEPID